MRGNIIIISLIIEVSDLCLSHASPFTGFHLGILPWGGSSPIGRYGRGMCPPPLPRKAKNVYQSEVSQIGP